MLHAERNSTSFILEPAKLRPPLSEGASPGCTGATRGTMQSGANTTRPESGAHTLYDRFAGLYDLTFKFNRYGRSLEHYLRETPVPLSANARILDAGRSEEHTSELQSRQYLVC